MEKTEEVLKKQIIEAMEGGKYRILLHRTFTGGDSLETDGITRSICQTGLRVFDGASIDFTTSDYRNDINIIMNQIMNAYNYKGSDKVFILKVPVGALEYIPGKSEPILCKGQGRNLYNGGNNCLILPQYIIGYVDVSKDGVSSLQPNTCKINTGDQQQIYANSVVARYRWEYPELLESIRTDRFYTDEEKMQFLQALYANYGEDGILSKGLKKHIERIIPLSKLEEKIYVSSDNGDTSYAVDRFVGSHYNKTISERTVEEEFRKVRKLKASEIYHAIPNLLNKEKTLGRPLTLAETIEEISSLYGYDKDIAYKATMSKKSVWDRFKEIFGRTKKQQLLTASTEQKDDDRQKFVEGLKTEEKHVANQSGITREQDREEER